MLIPDQGVKQKNTCCIRSLVEQDRAAAAMAGKSLPSGRCAGGLGRQGSYSGATLAAYSRGTSSERQPLEPEEEGSSDGTRTMRVRPLSAPAAQHSRNSSGASSTPWQQHQQLQQQLYSQQAGVQSPPQGVQRPPPPPAPRSAWNVGSDLPPVFQLGALYQPGIYAPVQAHDAVCMHQQGTPEAPLPFRLPHDPTRLRCLWRIRLHIYSPI